MKQINKKTWLDHLSNEDIIFIKRFVFSSGSLKELAQFYGVTYPTVRLRLDRLIAKIEVIETQDVLDSFEEILRKSFAEQKIDEITFKTLLNEYRKVKEDK